MHVSDAGLLISNLNPGLHRQAVQPIRVLLARPSAPFPSLTQSCAGKRPSRGPGTVATATAITLRPVPCPSLCPLLLCRLPRVAEGVMNAVPLIPIQERQRQDQDGRRDRNLPENTLVEVGVSNVGRVHAQKAGHERASAPRSASLHPTDPLRWRCVGGLTGGGKRQ